MAYELRKTLGRNMRFAQMNKAIDNQINRLQSHNTGPNVQMQINSLMQQKALNTQQMARPMSETEYAEYDDSGQYIGNTIQQNTGGFGQAVADGVNHAAQGVSLGWSDEAFGAIGGVGMTDTNNPAEYAINIGLNTAGSIAGEKFGSILENKTNDFLKERAKNLSFGLSKSASAFTKMGTNSLTNQINNWRKDDEW